MTAKMLATLASKMEPIIALFKLLCNLKIMRYNLKYFCIHIAFSLNFWLYSDREGVPSTTLREISILRALNHSSVVRYLK